MSFGYDVSTHLRRLSFDHFIYNRLVYSRSVYSVASKYFLLLGKAVWMKPEEQILNSFPTPPRIGRLCLSLTSF